MSIDHIIGESITQGLERYLNGLVPIRLWILASSWGVYMQ